ncbi:MAG: UDP-glucose/GDP-mannose dehydrogenase family protein [Candidatus Poribacteria bacterium]|nr:UDP-glucose/GDP-mannose dehydrogenase family protein [Candidatus Poribacteria bacterium]MDE0506900.1 UDP-glucose/GDP-mannose dehydrogenase family protein [Candidatus Poribacteria bacterium]
MKITIIGTGYVGLTTGLALAYLKHRVVGVDKDLDKISLLRQGISPIHETGIQALLDQTTESVCFTDDLTGAVADSDVIMIAVGTPPKQDGEADTRHVEAAAREVAFGLMPDREYVIAIKSTVPIGTNRRISHLVHSVLYERQVSADVYFVSNPEFLQEGLALRGTFYPDRVVVGTDRPEAVDAMRRLHEPILRRTFVPPSFLAAPDDENLPPLIATDATNAEMIKYAANTFLALKISFINEIAGLCERVEADVTEVARGVGLDSRISHRFLKAGVGWGGSCFPKDTDALLRVASEHGYSMPIVEAAREVNHRQRTLIIEKLQHVLKILRGRTIGILGLAFKPNTDDVRGSPALDIIRLLDEQGAYIRAHDPVAISHARQSLEDIEVEFVDDPYAVSEAADALVLVTDWDEYQSLNLNMLAKPMITPFLIDGRNIYSPDKAREAGFLYMGIGR